MLIGTETIIHRKGRVFGKINLLNINLSSEIHYSSSKFIIISKYDVFTQIFTANITYVLF